MDVVHLGLRVRDGLREPFWAYVCCWMELANSERRLGELVTWCGGRRWVGRVTIRG